MTAGTIARLPEAAAAAHAEVSRQAMMVAYVDSYWLLYAVSLAVIPVVLFMRPGRPRPGVTRRQH